MTSTTRGRDEMAIDGIRTAATGTPPMQASGAGASGSEAPARTVTFPRNEDSETLARRIIDRSYEHRSTWKTRALGGAIGAVAVGGIVAAIGRIASGPLAASGYAAFGGGGAVIGAVAGATLLAGHLLRMTPDTARDYAEQSLDFSARPRPELPPRSAEPTVLVRRVGEARDGISGTTIGGIVQLQRDVVDSVSVSTRRTSNSNGEPTIVIGGYVSGEEVTTEQVVRREGAELNSVGLGRVLYDPAGYASMSEAMEAFDGKHAAAIVKEGDRYLLVDADAESWAHLSDRSYAMTIADDRVKAVFANKGVYFPSSIGGSEANASRVFMFAQDQDIERELPTTVRELQDLPIGRYETNAVGPSDRFAQIYEVEIDQFHAGDEWSGPGWTSRDEAIRHMIATDGYQALVRDGDRYYVGNLAQRTSLGNDVDKNHMVDDSPEGSAVLGLRTTDIASGVELIEDQGGMYAPVGDWWIRANIQE